VKRRTRITAWIITVTLAFLAAVLAAPSAFLLQDAAAQDTCFPDGATACFDQVFAGECPCECMLCRVDIDYRYEEHSAVRGEGDEYICAGGIWNATGEPCYTCRYSCWSYYCGPC